ncbi:MAG: methylmalonyl Co-A mutase-associated GTPase MeaB [Fluviicola sp.]|nr:MAG: methylmalonyl Co-A mutase-associated GTPase MeaB [Fluviicola sp.]
MDTGRLKEWMEKRQQRKTSLNHDELLKGILAGDIQSLSGAITLLESNKKEDQIVARNLVSSCLSHSGRSIRIGITGVPGVGKSTFIESFGQLIIEKGNKIAVLAVDPSSEKSGGSILGDKTRMNDLSQSKNAFIRPSAAGKSLGGVARKTRESIILCEAAGFDYIFIETVGVGQSETAVHSMVDFFLLLMLAGAGDELQGIKRGIMEMADALVITKADGDNLGKAQLARKEYQNAMHLFPPNENEWTPQALVSSAIENLNIDKVLNTLEKFVNHTKVNGSLLQKRKKQDKYWLHETISDVLLSDFYDSEVLEKEIKSVELDVVEGRITSFEGAEFLIEKYRGK